MRGIPSERANEDSGWNFYRNGVVGSAGLIYDCPHNLVGKAVSGLWAYLEGQGSVVFSPSMSK